MTNFLTDCTRYEIDLKAYADGELSWLRRHTVRRHLTHCASCQEEIILMTQIAEDLRSAEPAGTLSPALREKLISPLAPNPGGTADETAATSGSPKIGGRGASPRRRPLPAWTFAVLTVVAWFVCFPLFQKVRENALQTSPLAPTNLVERNLKVFKAYPETPPPAASALPSSNATGDLTVRASDRAVTAPMMPSSAAPPERPAPMVVSGGGVPFVINKAGSLNSLSTDGDPDSLRQVHKEASIGVQVANPETTGDTIQTMVQETGGYVAANNLTTGDNGLKSGELIVKVPEPQFETFLAAVAKLGVVVSKNVTGQDITEKTSDAHEAQSVQESDLEQAEARLKALGSKAKWEDQENTRDLRIQLAQTRARLKLLKRMAELGTITIDLSQTPKAVPAPPVTNGFTDTLKATTHDALQSLVGSASALLALVIWLLAYAPLWVPLLLIGRYALKEYRRRVAI